MTGSERPLCDCPEPCACYAEGYAAGKDKAYFEVLANLEGPPHAGDCSCQPCLLKVMAPLARTSPGIFELVEVWALEGHDYCDRTRAHPGASRRNLPRRWPPYRVRVKQQRPKDCAGYQGCFIRSSVRRAR